MAIRAAIASWNFNAISTTRMTGAAVPTVKPHGYIAAGRARRGPYLKMKTVKMAMVDRRPPVLNKKPAARVPQWGLTVPRSLMEPPDCRTMK